MPRRRQEGFLKLPGFPIARRALARAALAVLLAGCGDDGAPQEIKDVRESAPKTNFRPASTAERFGFTGSPHAGNPHGGGMQPQQGGFDWTTPDGWDVKDPPGQMREVDFRLKRDPLLECYVSVAQGGIAANAARWFKQMAQEPISPAAVAALPKAPFLGQSGVLVDLEGTFVGMGQGEPKPGYRLMGIVVEEPGRTVTLKMTGPAAVVAEERESFLALAASFRAKAAAAPEPEGDSPLAWDAPPEWEPRQGHPMRVVTLAPKGSEGTECYVTILSGGAGGVTGNVNRWREQMGQGPLDAQGIAALETVKVLGQDSKLVEVTGSYTDMQGNKSAQAALLGVVCQLPQALVTIKMTGPADVIATEKDRFLAFCRSLRMP